MLDERGAGEVRIGDRHDVIHRRIGSVDDDEFVEAETFGIVPRTALSDCHLKIFLPEAGEQFAQQEDNQTGVRELDAGFAPFQFQAVDVRGDEIDEEQAADEVAARHGNKNSAHVPDRDERAVELLLHRVDTEVDLREGRGEDEDEREGQENDREFERDEKIAK